MGQDAEADRGCIIVIDSEESIRDLLSKYLRQQGYRIFGATAGRESAELLKAYPPSLVILDPGFDKSAAKRIADLKSEYPHSRFILMTGQPTLNMIISALRLGIDDVMVKPFCLDDLQTAITRIEARSRQDMIIFESRRRVQVLEEELLRHGIPLPGEPELEDSFQESETVNDRRRERRRLWFQTRAAQE